MAGVDYDLGVDDQVNFALHFNRHSEIARKQKVGLILFPVFAIAFAVLLGWLKERSVGWISKPDFFLPVIIFMGIYSLFKTPFFVERYSRSVYQKEATKEGGRAEYLFGKNHVDLLPDGLLHQSEHGEMKINWPSIVNIESNPDYLFIYRTPTNAIIIPKRAFPNSVAYQKFEEELKSYTGKLNAFPS